MVKKVAPPIADEYINHKKNIINLVKNGELDNLRQTDEYIDVIKHYWLIDSYISKYGFADDNHPANTLGAYENAIEKGYPIVIPVHGLSDGEVVCVKDKTLANSNNISGYVANLTLKDVKANKIVGSEDYIPTLSEALEHIKGRVPIIIEIMNEGLVGELEEKILNDIEVYINNFDLLDSVAIMSINPYTLQWFYKQAPWLPRIIQSGKFKVKEYAGIKTKRLQKLKFANTVAHADYVCYNAKDLPCRRINKVKPIGILAYNVQSQEEYLKVAKYCDSIIFENFEPEI